jgi:hypothetical protein
MVDIGVISYVIQSEPNGAEVSDLATALSEHFEIRVPVKGGVGSSRATIDDVMSFLLDWADGHQGAIQMERDLNG